VDVTVASVSCEDASVVLWEATESVISFVMPAIPSQEAGVHVIRVQHRESDKTATFRFEVVVYPEGPITLVSSFPSEGPPNIDTAIFVELNNCPRVQTADVSIMLDAEDIRDSVAIPLLSLDSTFVSTILTFQVDMNVGCVQPSCSMVFNVVITDKFQAKRVVTVPFIHVQPQPEILSVFPISGLVDSEVRIMVTVNNLVATEPATDTGGNDAELGSQIQIAWDGSSVPIIPDTLARKDASAVVFEMWVPVSSSAKTVDVVISNPEEDSASFQYTYEGAGPNIFLVEPAR
jgi:hypothetical protein